MKQCKKMKYLFFILIVMVMGMTFNVSGLNQNGEACGDNVRYSYNNEKRGVIISGIGPMENYTAGNSPFFIDMIDSVIIEEGVTTIGDFVFEGSNLKSIVIPDSVVSIGNRAFIDCDSLTEIVLPDSITSIDEYAFFGCNELKSIVLPKNLKTLGIHAFSDNISLEKVIIPCDLTSIEDNTFLSCMDMKELVVSGNVKNINSGAFKFCFALEKIYLSNSITSIDENAFEYCYSLSNVYYEGGLTEWNQIDISDFNNNYLTEANIHYQAHIHNYISNVTKEATCINEGRITYSCPCGDSFTKILNKLAHTSKNIIKEATLNTNGEATVKCSICDTVIEKKTIYYPKTIKLSTSKCTYNGKTRTPSVTVKDSKGNVLKKNIDYTVSYEKGRRLPGKYIIIVKFIGNYEGEKELEFIITSKATTGVKAKTQTTKTITLTWNKTTGATGYRVYLYSPNKDKYIVKASVKDTTTYKVTGLKTGTTYKFKIKPYVKTDDGTVIWGGASSVLATATKPATPKLKSATASSGKATLNWANVSSESGYQIYYSTSKSGNYEKMKSVSTDTLKYTTSKLTAGKTYYFKVRAYIKVDDKVIYGDFSDVKSVIIKKATSSGSSNSSGSSSNSSSSSSSKPEIGGGTYYITNTGKKYHVSGCRTLRGSKIAVSYEYASRNYEPCGVCLN